MKLTDFFSLIKYNLLKVSLTTILFIISGSAQASGTDSLFMSDEIIRIELRSDFSAIQAERTGDPEYHDGKLIYYTEGSKTKLSVKVMARGNFRLSPENCNFPPLLVDFRKSEVKNTIFENQDKLKLVTPCQYEEDVIDEYTIYKLYNQVTDLSFKVRLVKILYIDDRLNKRLFEKYSFFIEDKDHVAERNNAVAKDKFLTPFDINRENLQKLSVFEYLIGNKDWYITSRKNIVIMQSKDASRELYAVPYDFDFSGFVNAEYTKIKGISEEVLVERRVYQGLCYTEDELEGIFQFYTELRPVFESIIKNQKFISDYGRKQIIRYISNFYTLIKNYNLVRQEFLSECQTRKDFNISEK